MHLVGFIISIYHDARSPERHMCHPTWRDRSNNNCHLVPITKIVFMYFFQSFRYVQFVILSTLFLKTPGLCLCFIVNRFHTRILMMTL